ncbi:hypothetical protein RHDE110596_01200 [Prescottella defluvii]|uniref:hypothetical protein n=1 Tax=Prescottella defluvii TaxID=1323361 RepID=UPI0004F269D6|nr:hypothetical protein [Prescottella defluvii]
MIPSRTRLSSWNFDALVPGQRTLRERGVRVEDAAVSIEGRCNDLPEIRAWDGVAQAAAADAFGRAKRKAADVHDLASALADAMEQGFHALTAAKSSLLNRVAELEAGPFEVSDRWVVTLKPSEMSAEAAVELIAQRNSEQLDLNPLVTAVGRVDDELSDALRAAAAKHGHIEPELGVFETVAGLGEPQSDIPMNAGIPLLDYQQQERDLDAAVTVARTELSVNDQGEKTKTVFMQDGGRKVFTESSTFAGSWQERPMLIQEDFDPDGTRVATTKTYESDTGGKVTSITYEDRTRVESTEYRDGRVRTMVYPEGKEPQEIPPDSEFFTHPVLTTAGGALSAVETHTGNAMKNAIPHVAADTLENLHYGAKFGGPALAVGTALWDVYAADSPEAKCQAAIAGAAGTAGGWAGGASMGAAFGPVGAAVGGSGGAWFFGWLGTELGKAVCY